MDPQWTKKIMHQVITLIQNEGKGIYFVSLLHAQFFVCSSMNRPGLQVIQKELRKSPSKAQKAAMSQPALSDMYDEVMKLSTANKINQKNTWGLQLIDYIEDVLQADRETMNFQRASCTLDASIQIYSSRVDAVYKETFQVLGGLSHSQNRPKSDDGDEDEGNDSGDPGNGDGTQEKEKKQRKKRTGLSTLETKIEQNLNLKKREQTFEVDPLFQKTSAGFDEGGARSLLLNTLSVFHGCAIAFDSSCTLEPPTAPDGAAHVAQVRFSMNELSALTAPLYAGLAFDSLAICPAVVQFEQLALQLAAQDQQDEWTNAHAALAKAEAVVCGGGEVGPRDAELDQAIAREEMRFQANPGWADELADEGRFDANDGDDMCSLPGDDGDANGDAQAAHDHASAPRQRADLQRRIAQEVCATRSGRGVGPGGAHEALEAAEAAAVNCAFGSVSKMMDRNWTGLAHWKFTKKSHAPSNPSTKDKKSKSKVCLPI
jgi:hypothetical protein